MSKASQIIVLCEDKAQQVFVSRFLKKGWGVNPRVIRVRNYPNGRGAGNKHVVDNLSGEAAALRTRQASTILLVVLDADNLSVDQVKSTLDKQLQPPRGSAEPIAYIIPKWHIETWIAYLDGKNVDETDGNTYKMTHGKISESKEAHPFIDKLADKCRNNKEPESPPDSLVMACQEFNRRIRSVLKCDNK